MAMQLQPPTRPHTISNKSLPASSLATIGNAGLRRPSDRFALKSSFFSPSLSLLLLPQLKTTPASAARPRFSMRVASKQSYICRDCGYIYNDRTPFEKLTDKYFCPGKSFSPLLYFNLFPFHNNCSTYGEMGLICCFIITNSLR
ncbi:hypothetical protein FH972_018699 [Carpinus fangiana]|uniref:Rubredoxin-like domain-containing protein n=1 Tax=Carpinus fangiana TaxID=176857 RepID=A0A5N6RQ04_9ROSI|nr:hypothetical protein FH972_018699 [Carpinus fangiana]